MDVPSAPAVPPRYGWGRAAWPWLGAVITAALLAACYPPFHQGWLIWIALTPLVWAVWTPAPERPPSPRRWRRLLRRARPFWLGHLAGTLFFTATFHWLGALGVLFGSAALYGLPLLLGLYMGIYVGLWTTFLHFLLLLHEAGPLPLWRRAGSRAPISSTDHPQANPSPSLTASAKIPHQLPRSLPPFSSSWRNLAYAAAAASAWVALEWFRSWFLTGFGWDTLAVALRTDLPMIQIAAWTGAYGLSWLLVFTNVMAVIIVRRLLSELGAQFLTHIRWEFSATMALIVTVFAFGMRVLLQPAPATIPLRAAVLQPNIPQDIKFAGVEEENHVMTSLARLNTLAENLSPAPQLVVWPESCTPRGIFADEVTQQFALREAARGRGGLLLGSLEGELDAHDPENILIYNSAVLLTEEGRRSQIFRKIHLVIFGEYLPLRPWMPSAIADLIPGDLAAGHDFTVLDLPDPGLKLGALVCFEDTVPEVAAGLVKNGAQLLVNLTNDGWFLRSAGAEQHLANAVLRAVEFRRPILRCANTGVTGLIDPYGRVDRWLENFQEGIGSGTIAVPADPPLTFYARHGDWFAYGAVLFATAAAVRAGLRRRRPALHY